MACRRHSSYASGIALSILLFVLSSGVVNGVGSAQPPTGAWQTAELVYSGEGNRSPVLVADGYGHLHAFWGSPEDAEATDSSYALYYSKLSGGRWSQPIDIIVDNARYIQALFDASGRAHVFWSRGVADHLYHSWALETNLASAHSWSVPRIIGDGTQEFGASLDTDGVIHLAYAPQALSVVYLQSRDGGETWSEPVLIEEGTIATAFRYSGIALTENNDIHVVWAEYPLPESWPPQGILYSRSADGGLSWSEPLDLSLGEDVVSEFCNVAVACSEDEPAIATGGDNAVYVMWHGGVGTDRRYLRVSEDGGTTWANTETIMVPKAGIVGRSALAPDSSATMHIAMASAGGLCYCTAKGEALSAIWCLNSDYTGEVALAISYENRINVLYAPFKEGEDRLLWYQVRTSDVPFSNPVSPPTATSGVPTPVPTETPTLTSTPKPEPVAYPGPDTKRSSVDTRVGILLGLVPAFAITSLVFVVHVLRNRRP